MSDLFIAAAMVKQGERQLGLLEASSQPKHFLEPSLQRQLEEKESNASTKNNIKTNKNARVTLPLAEKRRNGSLLHAAIASWI